MIIYGRSSYIIVSYFLRDLDIFVDSDKNIKVSLIQRYVHVFWIPLFPYARKWVTVIDGKKYGLKPELEELVKRNAKEHKKVSPFSIIPAFSGLLLLLLVFCFIRMR